jgi:hypothetical protein
MFKSFVEIQILHKNLLSVRFINQVIVNLLLINALLELSLKYKSWYLFVSNLIVV